MEFTIKTGSPAKLKTGLLVLGAGLAISLLMLVMLAVMLHWLRVPSIAHRVGRACTHSVRMVCGVACLHLLFPGWRRCSQCECWSHLLHFVVLVYPASALVVRTLR